MSGRPIATGVKVTLGADTRDSLPPCGGGMGWGVVRCGTMVPHLPTPTPIPSPQGGGEEFAALANPDFTPMRSSPRWTATVTSIVLAWAWRMALVRLS